MAAPAPLPGATGLPAQKGRRPRWPERKGPGKEDRKQGDMSQGIATLSQIYRFEMLLIVHMGKIIPCSFIDLTIHQAIRIATGSCKLCYIDIYANIVN